MRLTLLFLLLILVCNGSYAQSLILKGKIVNSKGLPVPFASVYEKNTTSGTSANSDGEFQLKLKPGKRSIIFKAIGLGVISAIPGSVAIFMIIKFFKLEKHLLPSAFVD